jgi:hypothetical protein
MNYELNNTIEELAVKRHQHVGILPCPGKDCAGVQELISFGAECASAAIDLAMKIVKDTKV